jgi:hypothetical protein
VTKEEEKEEELKKKKKISAVLDHVAPGKKKMHKNFLPTLEKKKTSGMPDRQKCIYQFIALRRLRA